MTETKSFDFGGVDRPLTRVEATFLDALDAAAPPRLHVWLHADPDGTPWLIVSLDFVVNGCVRDTLRLDFDGAAIIGGWSPSFLNGDDGVRARAADVDTSPLDGIEMTGDSPENLASVARRWFEKAHQRWPTSERRHRWQV